MTEQDLQSQRDHEEDLIRLRGFRPIDDTFMRVIFRDNLPLAEGDPFEDRQHILYVNAGYQGEDLLGQLLHDFLCSDPEAMLTPVLADKVHFLKSDPKGVDIMCKIMEDLREESMQRGFERRLKEGREVGLQEGRQEGLEQARIESIKNIMDSLQYTAQQAMDLLHIPAHDRTRYMEKLQSGLF